MEKILFQMTRGIDWVIVLRLYFIVSTILYSTVSADVLFDLEYNKARCQRITKRTQVSEKKSYTICNYLCVHMWGVYITYSWHTKRQNTARKKGKEIIRNYSTANRNHSSTCD